MLGPDQVTAAQAFPRALVGVQGTGCLAEPFPCTGLGRLLRSVAVGPQAWPCPPLSPNGIGDDDGSSEHSPRALRAKSYVSFQRTPNNSNTLLCGRIPFYR